MSGSRCAYRISRTVVVWVLGLLFSIPLFAQANPEVVERRLDPSLRFVYRAAKGKGSMGLARAAEVHARVHKRKAAKKTADSRIELLLRYTGPEQELISAGFAVQSRVGGIYTGSVSVDRLSAVAELPRLRRMQSATTLSASVPRPSSGGSAIQSNRAGTQQRLAPVRPADATGSGVLIAFIDTGADVFHQDLRKADGSTRIRYLLDLSDPGDVDGDGDLDGTGPYGGTLYTEAQINAAIGAGTIGQKDTTGHGTHGLSVAAGDDPALPGIAPAADLLVVKATREDGTLSFTAADIVNALAFVDAKAAELGMPFVANLSLGTLFSSHDGRSLEEQAIDALVGPGVAGKAVVVAAGNASDNRGSLKRHFSGKSYVAVPVVQTLTVPPYTPNPGKGNDRIVLDLWYEGNDKMTVKVTSPNGHIVTAPFGDYADAQTPDGDVFIANLGGPNPENGDIEAIVLIDDWTGPAPRAGTWTATLEATEIGATGVLHGWLAEDSAVGNASPAFGGSADNALLVGKPGGAYNAVTVGSYARHLPGTRFLTSWTDVNGTSRTDSTAIDGDLSDFSSPGKTRDGRVKPEITAPGERIMGAVSRDALPGVSPASIYIFHPFPQADALLTDRTTNHAFGMLQGTSFSAPVVTGLVARILSTNPALDAIQIRNMLVNTASADAFTGAVPNNAWGYGKVDQSLGTAALPSDLRIGPDSLPAGTINEQYNFVFTASGGALPYSWVVSAGSLPAGLTLESRGFLSGKPTAAGSYPITIQVTDTSQPARTASKSYTISVASAANLHVTSVAHPVGHLDKPYLSQLNAAGGTPPYGWTLAGGSLPPGLTLNGSTGVIGGTPLSTGTYPFTLRVQDAAAATALKSAKIKITTPGSGDWSVLGKSVPTVTEIVVDPNDSNRVIASTTGIDAVFESTNRGESWQPISINNGLNSAATDLMIDPATSEIWGIQRDPKPPATYYTRRAKWYAPATGWTTVPQGAMCCDNLGPETLAASVTGTIYTAGFSGNVRSLFRSPSHGAWTAVGQVLCGDGFSDFIAPTRTKLTLSPTSQAMFVVRSQTSRFVCGSLDGGVTWADVTNGSSGTLDIQVSSTDPTDVLLGGGNFVERSVDGGRNWSKTTLSPSANLLQLRRSPSNSAVAVAATSNSLYKSTDGGSTWTRLPVMGAYPAMTAVAIDPSNADTLYVASAEGVRRSTDGGLSWSNSSAGLVRRTLGDVRVSSASLNDVAIASGEGPFLSRTSGEAWTKSTPGMTSVVTRRLAISGVDANLYFAGTDNAVYRSTNRGVTWTQVDGGVANGYPVMALEADPFDAGYVLFSLSGTRGTYRSTDGGLTFASANVGLPFGTPNDLSFARDAAHAGRVFVALTTDGLYRSENRGATWAAFGLNTQTTGAVEPAPSDSDYVYAAGATQMYFLDPSIGTWQAATTGPANPILSLAVDPINKLVAYAGADHPGTAGNTGGVYKTTDGGRNWSRLVGLLDQLDVVALAAHPTTSGIVWAATLNGGVFRTDDGGVSWRELGNYGTVADLTNVNVQDPSNPFLLFAGTEGYGVQASTDGGQAFVPRVTGLGNLYVNALAFDPDAPATLYAATDNGVYKSTNSGNTWTATPLAAGEITDLVTDNEGSGKRIWATVKGQGVAYSPDGGASFAMRDAGLASLQLTGVEIESRGAGKRIWATTQGGEGIAFSDDLGLTWKSAAGNGLTDRNINDLAIQSGTGKRIWATSNSGVFVSDDDGLSWRDLSIGLPAGIPATSVAIDPNSREAVVSLYSEEGGGVYRGGSVNGVWKEYSAGLSELKVKKLTRSNGYTIDPTTLGARFYAATAGDGVYSTVLATNVADAPVVTTYRLPRALLRLPYAAVLAASGGRAPYGWTIVEGSLPPGLALDTATGEITGEPGAAGVFAVTVQAADANQRTGAKQLTIEVVSPDTLQVTHCTPNEAVRGTSATVTVHGSGFVATPVVSFGAGVTVNSVTQLAATTLSVNISIDPAATAGYRAVTVTNPDTGSITLPDGFKVEYPNPIVTGAAPSAGSRKQTLDVVVTGTEFESGATVSFGSGVAVNSVTPGSSTSLTANVTISSTAALGTRNVTVTNVNGFSGTGVNLFTVREARPVITNIAPAQGNQGSTFNITITGTDFQSGAVASFGSGVTVNSTSFVSATQLTANVTIATAAGLGYRTATVQNPDGQSGSLAQALLVKGPVPQVLSTSPGQGLLGATLNVAVNGTGFQAGATVSFGAGVTVNSVTVTGGTQINTSITISTGATPGQRTVTVTNLDAQSASKANAFEVRAFAPVLSTVNPTQGARGATLSVTLGGSEFRSGASVSFGPDIVVNSVSVPSATQATASITIGDTAALGARAVTLTNSDNQSSTLAASFTVRDFAPSIVSIEPATLGPCVTGSLVVKGYYFRSGLTAALGQGVTVNSVSLQSDTSMTLSVTTALNATAGPRTLTITNPDGQSAQGVNLFQVASPAYVSSTATYAWIDAAGGTDAGIDGDDVAASIPIGFSFPFDGASYTTLTVSSNGYLTFGGAGTAFENAPIPSAGQPNRLVAVYWDDLRVLAGTGKVTYQLLGSAPARKLVVQWTGVTTTAGSNPGSFQAVLYESDGSILLQYQDVTFGDALHDGGVSATAGVENGTGSSGVQVWHNTAGLAAGTAYLLKVPACAAPPSLSIDDVSVSEGNSGTTNAVFTVTLSSSGTSTITVEYSTADVTATAGADYTAASGTLTFGPGELSKTITVPVIGDTLFEPVETFSVTLSTATNATIADGQGIGTIISESLEPPSNVTAAATSLSAVTISWSGAVNAATYEIHRRGAGGNFQFLASTAATTFTDSTVSPATAYLYAVKSVDSSAGKSGFSSADLATTVVFTDPVLVSSETPVRAVHLSELRNAVNLVRALAGLAPASFSSPSPAAGVVIRSVHVTELRTALGDARAALGLPAVPYVDPAIMIGVTAMKAAHIMDLRGGVN